jgi:hypothetical protein
VHAHERVHNSHPPFTESSSPSTSSSDDGDRRRKKTKTTKTTKASKKTAVKKGSRLPVYARIARSGDVGGGGVGGGVGGGGGGGNAAKTRITTDAISAVVSPSLLSTAKFGESVCSAGFVTYRLHFSYVYKQARICAVFVYEFGIVIVCLHRSQPQRLASR